jgi:hypothetical protein
MRRLFDAFVLLAVLSNGYHVLVCACRFFTSSRRSDGEVDRWMSEGGLIS